ncbi:DUF2087 domain-containing protein [Rathayibacter sp. CAU 1779]
MTDDTRGPGTWRAPVAALANDDARTVYARLTAGMTGSDAQTGLPTSKWERALQTLARGGLVAFDEASGEPVPLAPFAGILAANPVESATGVDKFLRGGRIDRYPMSAGERHALLLYVAERAFRPTEELTEAQVNERLRVFTEDHVTLRRYLVDAGILERSRSGGSYALSALRNQPL